MTNNEIYGKKAHSLIPAGAHTYSRTDEVFPGNAPRVFEKTKGVYCWDVDGNKYIDYAMACRSVTVGYGFERIADAAIAQIRNGNTASKASKVEVDAAERVVLKRATVEFDHRAGQVHGGKVATAEAHQADFLHAFGQGEAGKVDAVEEHMAAQFFHALGQ